MILIKYSKCLKTKGYLKKMKSKVGNFIFRSWFLYVVLGITIVSEGGEGGGVGFVIILMGLFLMSFPYFNNRT